MGSYFDSNYNGYTLIEHWNGSRWSVVPSPTSASGSDDLVDIKAISSNDVWAIGSSGIASPTTLIEHWNGSTWSIVPDAILPAGSTLHGLAVVSSNDVWAVGDEPNASYGKYALTEHWNGKQWSSIPAVTNTSNYSSLSSVTAIASNNVWAVGSTTSPTNTQNNGDTFIEHWNGTTWSVVPVAHKGSTTKVQDNLEGVATITSNDAWAVGSTQGAITSTLIEHWNGSQWRIVPSP